MTTNSDSTVDRASELTPSLVLRLRKGDAEAGALLDELFRDALFRFCWGYLGSTDEAEDAVQDVCFKVLSASEVPERFRPWLYRIARNHCLNLLRGRRRRRDGQPLPAGSGLPVQLTGQLTRLARAEQTERMTEAFNRLPDDVRELLRLRYAENLSRGEIAEVLELPESVVKSRLFEGLKKLREYAADLDTG